MSTSLSNFKLWYYTPSLPAAVIATIVFGCLTVYHGWRLIKTRTWFCMPFVVGGLFEVIGYAARGAAHNNMKGLTPYIIQSLLLLLAPPLFAASIYMILGRIIRTAQAESHSIIRRRLITKIFVCGDVLCFFIQSGGGGIQATGNANNFKLGEHIILGGLILQIAIFFFFLVVAGVFHKRLRQRPIPESLDTQLPWERLMWILYSVSLLITARNVFRVIEYAMGYTGYLLTHEWSLYVFDGLLMALVLVVCTAWYQTDLSPRSTSPKAHDMEQQNYQPKERV